MDQIQTQLQPKDLAQQQTRDNPPQLTHTLQISSHFLQGENSSLSCSVIRLIVFHQIPLYLVDLQVCISQWRTTQPCVNSIYSSMWHFAILKKPVAIFTSTFSTSCAASIRLCDHSKKTSCSIMVISNTYSLSGRFAFIEGIYLAILVLCQVFEFLALFLPKDTCYLLSSIQ